MDIIRQDTVMRKAVEVRKKIALFLYSSQSQWDFQDISPPDKSAFVLGDLAASKELWMVFRTKYIQQHMSCFFISPNVLLGRFYFRFRLLPFFLIVHHCHKEVKPNTHAHKGNDWEQISTGSQQIKWNG